MRVTVNGTPQEMPAGVTLQQLLDELHLAPTRVACEVNLKVVRRVQYPDTTLCEGDTIEIIQMVAGG